MIIKARCGLAPVLVGACAVLAGGRLNRESPMNDTASMIDPHATHAISLKAGRL